MIRFVSLTSLLALTACTDDTGISPFNHAPGEVKVLAGGLSQPNSLAVEGGTAWVIDRGDALCEGRILQVSSGGDVSTAVADLPAPAQLGVRAGTLYWINLENGACASSGVHRQVPGGEPERLAADKLATPHHLAATADRIWVAHGTGLSELDEAGDPTPRWNGNAPVTALAADDRRLVFADDRNLHLTISGQTLELERVFGTVLAIGLSDDAVVWVESCGPGATGCDPGATARRHEFGGITTDLWTDMAAPSATGAWAVDTRVGFGTGQDLVWFDDTDTLQTLVAGAAASAVVLSQGSLFWVDPEAGHLACTAAP